MFARYDMLNVSVAVGAVSEAIVVVVLAAKLHALVPFAVLWYEEGMVASPLVLTPKQNCSVPGVPSLSAAMVAGFMVLPPLVSVAPLYVIA